MLLLTVSATVVSSRDILAWNLPALSTLEVERRRSYRARPTFVLDPTSAERNTVPYLDDRYFVQHQAPSSTSVELPTTACVPFHDDPGLVQRSADAGRVQDTRQTFQQLGGTRAILKGGVEHKAVELVSRILISKMTG